MKFINWRKLRWAALFTGLLTASLFVFASNRFLYLSHQRFPVLAGLQWNHQTSSEHRARNPIIIGHRGSGLPSTNPDAAPDDRLIGNTKRSIAAAIEANVDWIEIDIRITRDRQVVVFHDATTEDRTTNAGAVEEMTLAELKAGNVLVDPPEKILALKEVFDEFQAGQRRWILDVKVSGVSGALIDRIEAAHIPKEQIIIFGNHHILQEYTGKGYRLGYTTLYKKHRKMILSPADVIERCKEHAYDLLVVPIFFVTPLLVAKAREHDLEVWSYDSNDPRDLRYCVECGVQGLIVDTPKAAMSQFHD